MFSHEQEQKQNNQPRGAECRVQSAECRVQSKLRLFICVALAVLVGAVGLIVALIVIPANATSEITGHGLINDPYVITAPEHWGQVVAHQWADANEITYVKLGADIVANNGSFGSGTGYSSGALHVPAGKNISLDLGTYKIDRGLTTATAYGSVIINEGNLTINGDAQLHDADGYRDEEYQVHNVYVTGGMITGGFNNTRYYAGGISVRKGTVVMNGGAIYNNQTAGNAEFTGCGVNVGTENGVKDGVGAVGEPEITAFFYLSGGFVTLNYGYGRSCDGAGIGVANDGYLEMHGGDISWNSSFETGGSYGGGISTYRGSVIDGGKIRNNYCTGTGGGIKIHSSTLELSNVEITGNIARGGDAAINFAGTELKLGNCVITDNIAANNSSNAIGMNANNTIELYGKVILQNNYWENRAKKISFLLLAGQKINIVGEITDDSDIYIEMAEAGVFTSGFAQNSPNTNPEVFSSNLQGLIVATTANGQELEIRASNGNTDDWNAVVKRSMNEKSATNFTVTNGWTANADGSFGSGRGFGNQPYAVASTGYDNLRIPATANINLTIPTGQTLSRNLTTAKNDGYVIKVYGTLSVNGGGTIRGGNNAGNGGAIYVADGGRLTLSNINLTGNQASRGAAVYVAAGGTLILDSAIINGNTALLDGGGIYVEAGATVYIQNSTAVMNNQSRNNVDNLFLANGAKVVIYSNLTAGSASSYVGVTLENGVGSFADATAVTD